MQKNKFEGVAKIISFNRHWYALGLLGLVISGVGFFLLPNQFHYIALAIFSVILFVNLASILASYWIFDRSNLYDFSRWNGFDFQQILNLHAGYNEIIPAIIKSFPEATTISADFYQAKNHTEKSIAKARELFPNKDQSVAPNSLPFPDQHFDCVLLFMSAHEIRDHQERHLFFSEIRRVMKNNGTLILTEHFRDFANFFAFNFGAFHFYPKKTWHRHLEESGLQIKKRNKITPFINEYIIIKP
ncbi:MAG: class I SAM-dependent methyltransferase [Cryomorphaceae bacterium]|nr:class I SAM-dependent methyltransferase [Cryomorphaceae bacterium]